MVSSYPVVLFDLDGTLVDGYLAITNSLNAVRASALLPPLAAEQIRPLVGRGLETLLSEVGTGDVRHDAAAYREHYATTMMSGTNLFPDAKKLLDALQKSGSKLGVCSNKLARFTTEILVQLGIAEQFDAVLGPELVARPKPAPDMLLAAIDQLGGTPSETLYVGDMSIDILAGRAAGVTVWAVATGSESVGQLQQAKPDRIFADLAGIHAAFGFFGPLA